MKTCPRFAATRRNSSNSCKLRDNGIGIPATDVDRVFDAFKRLHSSSSYEGTGLGLAICKKIVERHGGSIWCASKEGLGTSFYFTLSGV